MDFQILLHRFKNNTASVLNLIHARQKLHNRVR